MRLLVTQLRRILTHRAGQLILDQAGAKILKIGLAKAAGGVTAGLVIPVSALATYSIPAAAIQRMTAPIVGAAPEIFDTRALTTMGRTRFQSAIHAPRSIREALDRSARALSLESNRDPAPDPGTLAFGDADLLESAPGAGTEEHVAAPPPAEPPVAPSDDDPSPAPVEIGQPPTNDLGNGGPVLDDPLPEPSAPAKDDTEGGTVDEGVPANPGKGEKGDDKGGKGDKGEKEDKGEKSDEKEDKGDKADEKGDDSGDKADEKEDEGDKADEKDGDSGDKGDKGDDSGDKGDEGDEGDKSDDKGDEKGDKADEKEDQGDKADDKGEKSDKSDKGDD